MRHRFLLLLLVLASPLTARAQAWSGIIDPARAVDWSIAGIAGGLPDANWTQCGTTIAAYGSSGSPASPSKINAALSSCPPNHYVQLGAGSFYLSAAIVFPTSTRGHLALRGMGANSTFLYFSGSTNCGNAVAGLICMAGGDQTYPGGPTTAVRWTAGYKQGTTQITLSKTSGITLNKTLLVLYQCDIGFTGPHCEGSAIDNGNYFVCSAHYNGTVGCSVSGPDGKTWSPNAWQQEIVTATAINAGGCGSTCVTISQPLKHPNWASGQSPQAVLIQPVIQQGIENLAIDGRAAGAAAGQAIGILNAYQCWVSGVKIANVYAFGIYGLDVSHLVIKDNYFAHSIDYPNAYAIRLSWAGDDLVQNNIIHAWKCSFANDGPSSGDVIAYNFSVNQIGPGPTGFMWGAFWTHSAGDDFNLREGNIGDQAQDDNVHGSHLNASNFRNFLWGWESCANRTCGSDPAKDTAVTALIQSSGARYANNIGNVLGEPAIETAYIRTTPFSSLSPYNLGGGGTNSPATPFDPLVASTGMRWGNYDTYTGAVRW
jgi:hypothetical protein